LISLLGQCTIAGMALILCTEWTVNDVLVDPWPFNAVKRVWIDQDVIYSPHCMMIEIGKIFEQDLQYFDYFIQMPYLKSNPNPDWSLVHTIVCTHHSISLEDASTLYSLSPLPQKICSPLE
jgi:hypothetical protein